jgi:hypothetical protein
LRPSFSNQLLVAVHDAQAALDLPLGRETAAAFTEWLESTADLR